MEVRYVVTYMKLRRLNDVIGAKEIDFCGKSKLSSMGRVIEIHVHLE